MKAPAPPYLPGQRHVVTLAPGIEMAFRYVPPGEFRMGSRFQDDYAQETEEPVHRVRIPHGFWLGETPVTQEQFALWARSVGEEHENEFKDRPNHPAENMDWRQAVRYCGWLAEQMRGASAFPVDVALACLPTEAEWEYACRAKSETEYYNGDGEAALADVGWYEGNSGNTTHAVDERREAHPWGLQGMHGNVWEWCHDEWGEDWSEPSPVYRRTVDGDPDPGAAARAKGYAAGLESLLEEGWDRVLRGGSWYDDPAYCRSAYRNWEHPDDRYRFQGFRVCLAPGPAFALRATAGRPAAASQRRSLEQETERAEAAAGEGDGGRGTRPESKSPGAAGAGGDFSTARLPRRPGAGQPPGKG